MTAAPRAGDVTRLAHDLRRAFLDPLATFSLRGSAALALPPRPPKRAIVRVVAIGKAAVPMLQGALDRWPARIGRALAGPVDAAAAGASFELAVAAAASAPATSAAAA